MALIKCKECGHLVSDKAKRCPKCGCPVQRGYEANEDTIIKTAPTYGLDEDTIYQDYSKVEKKKNNKKWLWLMLILLVLAGTVYFIYTVSSDAAKMEKLEKEKAKLKSEKQNLEKKEKAAKQSKKNKEKKNDIGNGIDYTHNNDKSTLDLTKDNSKDFKMPTYKQIINLYQHICNKGTYGDYNYAFVNRKNMQSITNHIEGMKLLQCHVKNKRIYTEAAGEEIEYSLPIICCGINSEVSKIDYVFISDASFKSKSEHSCGIFWFRNEYQDHYKVYFKNGKDALNFSKQMEQNTEYDGNSIVDPIGLMIDNYNPILESDGYVFNFISF